MHLTPRCNQKRFELCYLFIWPLLLRDTLPLFDVSRDGFLISLLHFLFWTNESLKMSAIKISMTLMRTSLRMKFGTKSLLSTITILFIALWIFLTTIIEVTLLKTLTIAQVFYGDTDDMKPRVIISVPAFESGLVERFNRLNKNFIARSRCLP